MRPAFRFRWQGVWLALIGVALWGAHGLPRVAAATPPPLTPQVHIAFGDAVTIILPLEQLGPVQRVEIYLRPEGQVETYTQDMVIDGPRARYVHPLTEKPLPLFGQVFYWFKIYPAQGPAYESPAFVFIYEDNRFMWQSRAVEPVTVYWYEGNLELAEIALRAAHMALQNAFIQWQGRLAQGQTVRVYMYANARDLHTALSSSAGPPDHDPVPQHTVLTVATWSPEGRVALQRDIAHQVAHIVLRDTVGEGYANLPWWLKEGLATLAEPQTQTDDYTALRDAALSQQLIPLAQLCRPEPWDDPEAEALARAEAGAFVAHLYARYGPAGLQRLLEGYANGMGCDEGFRAALGTSLTALEDDWRSAQGLFPQHEKAGGWAALAVALAMLAPFLALGWWWQRQAGGLWAPSRPR